MNQDLEDLDALFLDLSNGQSLQQARKKHNIHINKNKLLNYYTNNFTQQPQQNIINILCNKPLRSWSGVIVVTVVMKPDKFSCPHNCHYCPNETIQNGAQYDMPRSYLSNEPAVARAKQHNFDAVAQVHNRLSMLKKNGHNLDKLEIIVLGGTFSAYPNSYKQEFITDLYYAANTFSHSNQSQILRNKESLQNEQFINENADFKIIGISLETRPDYITKLEIKRLRKFGCTRVQLGIQHTDNDILDYVNRGHHVEASILAIRRLRNNGFKIDLHIMPDLPGSNPQKDIHMITQILEHPNFIPDYLKIYPCLDVDFTEIRKWKLNGSWKPYSDSDDGTLITNVVLHAKLLSKEYIRFNRIQRDFCEEIPEKNIIGYSSKNIRSNFRQILHSKMKSLGISCKCIRCREIKNNSFNPNLISYKINSYITNSGKEFFISANVNNNQHILAFIRLRIPLNNNDYAFNSIKNCAFIRELHVYGGVVKVGDINNNNNVQHLGIGTQLISLAEHIAYNHNFTQIAVISGVGVRNYYRKFGYKFNQDGDYMIKHINYINYLINSWKRLYFLFKTLHHRYTIYHKIIIIIFFLLIIRFV